MNKIPLKVLVPCRIISIIFGALTLFNLLYSLSLLSRNFGVFSLIYLAYAALSWILAYGFWKTKKWIVFISGGATVAVAVLNIANIIRGTQRISQALIGVVVLCALFLFSYFSRNFLAGEQKNFKILILFLALIFFTQLATFFLK